jgi:mannonate dehydratase
VFSHAYTFSDGMLYPGDVPGHGVEIDELLAAKYPYQRAYLPVNRLQHDATLWSW